MYFYTVKIKVKINQDQETYFNEQYVSKNEMEFFSNFFTMYPIVSTGAVCKTKCLNPLFSS